VQGGRYVAEWPEDIQKAPIDVCDRGISGNSIWSASFPLMMYPSVLEGMASPDGRVVINGLAPSRDLRVVVECSPADADTLSDGVGHSKELVQQQVVVAKMRTGHMTVKSTRQSELAGLRYRRQHAS
jgi:hypothetical protein